MFNDDISVIVIFDYLQYFLTPARGHNTSQYSTYTYKHFYICFMVNLPSILGGTAVNPLQQWKQQ